VRVASGLNKLIEHLRKLFQARAVIRADRRILRRPGGGPAKMGAGVV
jgi:hypothetical protein